MATVTWFFSPLVFWYLVFKCTLIYISWLLQMLKVRFSLRGTVIGFPMLLECMQINNHHFCNYSFGEGDQRHGCSPNYSCLHKYCSILTTRNKEDHLYNLCYNAMRTFRANWKGFWINICHWVGWYLPWRTRREQSLNQRTKLKIAYLAFLENPLLGALCAQLLNILEHVKDDVLYVHWNIKDVNNEIYSNQQITQGWFK